MDSPRKREKSMLFPLQSDLGPALLLMLLGVLFFFDPLFSSKTFFFRDILNFHYPLRRALIDTYSGWQFPLWNPYIYLGQPMLANPNYMAFYPTNLFHLFLPFNYAFKLHFIVHPILGGLGAYFLLRRLEIGRIAAFASASAYQFSGPVLSFLNLYNIVPAVALLPWIAWAYYGALQERWLPRCLLFGGFFGLQTIAMEPLMFQCNLWLLAALSLYVVLESVDRVRAFKRVMLTGLIGSGFAAGLAAVQILPTLELLPRSGRSDWLDFSEVTRWSMHPLDFLNTLVPNLFGNYYTLNLATSWGEWIHEGREGYLVSFFLGSTVFMLCSFAFATSKRRLLWISTSVVLISSFLGLGRYNVAFEWIYNHVPFFGLGRYPCKYFLLCTLALCILAGLGLDSLISGAASKNRSIGVSFVLAAMTIAIGMLCVWFYWQRQPEALEQVIRSTVRADRVLTKDFAQIAGTILKSIFSSAIYMLLACCLILLHLLSSRSKILPTVFTVLIIAELVPANLRLTPLISDADMDFVAPINAYIQQKGPRDLFRTVPPTLLRPMPDLHLETPNRSSAWVTLFYRLSGQPFFGIMNGISYSIDRSVDHLNTKESEYLWSASQSLPEPAALTLLSRINSPLIVSLQGMADPRIRPVASFKTMSELNVGLYWLEGSSRRAFFVSGSQFVTTPAEALKTLLDPSFPFGTTVLLEGAQRSYQEGEQGAGEVEVLEYRSARVVCKVNAKKPGNLVLLDSYYPGWVAMVDGKECEIQRANYGFRAVGLSAGEHRVEIFFRSSSFKRGLLLSLLTLIGGLSALLYARFRITRGIHQEF